MLDKQDRFLIRDRIDLLTVEVSKLPPRLENLETRMALVESVSQIATHLEKLISQMDRPAPVVNIEVEPAKTVVMTPDGQVKRFPWEWAALASLTTVSSLLQLYLSLKGG